MARGCSCHFCFLKKNFFRDFAATLPRIFRNVFVERRSGAWQQSGSVAANGESNLTYALFAGRENGDKRVLARTKAGVRRYFARWQRVGTILAAGAANNGVGREN